MATFPFPYFPTAIDWRGPQQSDGESDTMSMAENTADTPQLAMNAAQLTEYLDEVFPELQANGPPIHVEHVAPYKARLRMEFLESELRPGGTLSGPSMFKLADVAFYGCLLAMIGPVPLAVTTNMSHQLHPQADARATCSPTCAS